MGQLQTLEDGGRVLLRVVVVPLEAPRVDEDEDLGQVVVVVDDVSVTDAEESARYACSGLGNGQGATHVR